MRREEIWDAIHAERAAIAAELDGLDAAQWQQRSLCDAWTVEETVAHLTAGASTGMIKWLASMAGARFDPDVHNRRRIEEYRGATPAETLARFRRTVGISTAPTGHTAAWLGETVVHGQDIRQPLGMTRTPPVAAVTEVARFFAARDFTVASRRSITGLRLEATDGEFAAGTDGPLVSGTTLALTMAMAGRAVYCDDLTGPGVETLRNRL
ncbi:maleylpyruvate isomerase family mycothiol-dependent enzyme [Catenuloplanes japonicus]|uniref:maleylpyruvate isomerase family mycothiol-dependent enzyme n=1 Tax=Catenuloplanes japonicus TaxID=33876 RepID=UPI000527E256|nr:maleylpyruvate isomerase family mycothiol-dependent enzyme [Catenuloplanes japonicus]